MKEFNWVNAHCFYRTEMAVLLADLADAWPTQDPAFLAIDSPQLSSPNGAAICEQLRIITNLRFGQRFVDASAPMRCCTEL